MVGLQTMTFICIARKTVQSTRTRRVKHQWHRLFGRHVFVRWWTMTLLHDRLNIVRHVPVLIRTRTNVIMFAGKKPYNSFYSVLVFILPLLCRCEARCTFVSCIVCFIIDDLSWFNIKDEKLCSWIYVGCLCYAVDIVLISHLVWVMHCSLCWISAVLMPGI